MDDRDLRTREPNSGNENVILRQKKEHCVRVGPFLVFWGIFFFLF